MGLNLAIGLELIKNPQHIELFYSIE